MNKPRKLRFGLLPKIILFLTATLVPLAAITWWISVQALTTNLTEEFTSKGTAIAKSLASSGVDLLLTRDASTVQGVVDQFGAINGVKYVMVYDPQRTLVAHTFSPLVPAGIVEKNLVPGEAAQQIRDITYPDPVTGAIQQMIDIGVPVLAASAGPLRNITLPSPQVGNTSTYGHGPLPKPSTMRVDASPAIWTCIGWPFANVVA